MSGWCSFLFFARLRANPDELDGHGDSPLHVACRRDRRGVRKEAALRGDSRGEKRQRVRRRSAFSVSQLGKLTLGDDFGPANYRHMPSSTLVGVLELALLHTNRSLFSMRQTPFQGGPMQAEALLDGREVKLHTF